MVDGVLSVRPVAGSVYIHIAEERARTRLLTKVLDAFKP